MAASKKRAKLAADLLGAGAAARAADLSTLTIARRDRRADAERLRVIENETLRDAEERGAPAAETLFYKKGSATAVTFRPNYWTYERHTEREEPAEFAFESKAAAPRPTPLPVEVAEAVPEARPTQAQVTAALTSALIEAEPETPAVEAPPAASQTAEVMVLPTDWGALSPEKVAALLSERAPETDSSAPAAPAIEAEPLPSLLPLPAKPSTEKMRKALLLLWPEQGAAPAPVVELPAAEAPESGTDAGVADTEAAPAAEIEPPLQDAVPVEASTEDASPPQSALEPATEAPAEALVEPAAEAVAPTTMEALPEALLVPEAPDLSEAVAPLAVPESEPIAPIEPAQADNAMLTEEVTEEVEAADTGEAPPDSLVQTPLQEHVPWFAADEGPAAERAPPALAAEPAPLVATAPSEPWPLVDAVEVEEEARLDAADDALPPGEDQVVVVSEELGAAIESVLAQRWYGTGAPPADWKSTVPSLPAVVPVSESSLIAELAEARGEEPATVVAPAPATSWGDRVLGLICAVAVLAVGYFGYAIWGGQLLAALDNLLH